MRCEHSPQPILRSQTVQIPIPYIYDGDGRRVMTCNGVTTTVYIGDYFEWNVQTGTMTKYYYAGAERLAMRSGAGAGTIGLVWIVGDHLGSTSITVDAASGAMLSELRYKPWGEVRYEWGVTGTKYKFTGQREQVGGLYDYGARFYDSSLNRFASPDTLVPDYYNPLDWDRYSYTRNNPLKYTDPTGHTPACDRDDWACQHHWDYPIVDDDDKYTFDTGLSEEDVNTLHDIEDFVAPILIEPIDWMTMYEDCTQGECSPLMLLGLLPFIPGSFGNRIDDLIEALRKLDGVELTVDEALDLATDFLGDGYKYMGKGRFVSADGLRQVRMGDTDLLGLHGNGPHINLDLLGPNPVEPGSFTQLIRSIHIYFFGR